MGIQTQIERIVAAKAAIREAIVAKGVTVSADAKLEDMPAAIAAINSSGIVPKATIIGAGYITSGITVTMGGVDVTSSVLVDGKISIGQVTGDLEITIGELVYRLDAPSINIVDSETGAVQLGDPVIELVDVDDTE